MLGRRALIDEAGSAMTSIPQYGSGSAVAAIGGYYATLPVTYRGSDNDLWRDVTKRSGPNGRSFEKGPARHHGQEKAPRAIAVSFLSCRTLGLFEERRTHWRKWPGAPGGI